MSQPGISKAIERKVFAIPGPPRAEINDLTSLVIQEFIKAGTLSVENLAAQWEERLEMPSRLCLAEPPADSPSTIKAHLFEVSLEQSASLPGSDRLFRADLRKKRSRLFGLCVPGPG